MRRRRCLLPTDQNRILKRVQSIISDPVYGAAIRQDLTAGIHTLPTWMQDLVRNATFQRHPSNGASKIRGTEAMNHNYLEVISATSGERRDLFLAAAATLGSTEQNVEKDFWGMLGSGCPFPWPASRRSTPGLPESQWKARGNARGSPRSPSRAIGGRRIGKSQDPTAGGPAG
jgi:hypothetical protein